MKTRRLYVVLVAFSILLMALWVGVATGSSVLGRLYPLVFLIPLGNRVFLSVKFPERRRELAVGAFQYIFAFIVLASYEWVTMQIASDVLMVCGFIGIIALAFLPGGRFGPIPYRK